MIRTRVVAIWCAGCQRTVPGRSWNQDTYLCNDCTANVLHLIRRWASGKTLDRFPIGTLIHSRVEAR